MDQSYWRRSYSLDVVSNFQGNLEVAILTREPASAS